MPSCTARREASRSAEQHASGSQSRKYLLNLVFVSAIAIPAVGKVSSGLFSVSQYSWCRAACMLANVNVRRRAAVQVAG